MTGDARKSLYEARASSSEGRLGLAAAHAALQVSKILNVAKRLSGRQSNEIATTVGVSPGRVSQVLNGDGNLHVATIARFVESMGYHLRIDAVDETGRSICESEAARGRRPDRQRNATRLNLCYGNADGVATVSVDMPHGTDGEPAVLLWAATQAGAAQWSFQQEEGSHAVTVNSRSPHFDFTFAP